MKNVIGGKAYSFTTSCTAAPGYTAYNPGECSGTGPTSSSVKSACQTQLDSYCSGTPGCVGCSVS